MGKACICLIIPYLMGREVGECLFIIISVCHHDC